MALSNTATPIYYGEFREKVIRGEFPVCEYVSDEMCRIDALIANPDMYYDDAAINGFIAFCESEMTLTDGSDLELLDSFKLWAESCLSWFYYVERSVYETDQNGTIKVVTKRILKRLVNKQYLVVGRSAAKSLYVSCLQAYFLTVDSSTTHQITTAPTMKQAQEVTAPIITAITRARGPWFKWLTKGSIHNTSGNKHDRVKLQSTKEGIKCFLTNSLLEIRPMSINKLQGLRVKFASVDEWKSGDIREDVIGAIEQGAAKVDDYLIVAVSSEGTVRHAAGDTMAMELTKILKNEYINPHVSIWYYKLDSIQEVADPTMWRKANPNLGYTVTYETYQLDVEKAEQNPSARNDILSKRFGIPMEGHTRFFTYEETLQHNKREYWNMPCALGCDLSRGDDFCAFTFLFPLRESTFGVKTLSFITSKTLMNLPDAMRIKYNDFIQEGSLIIHDGMVLDMDMVYEDLMRHIDDNGYDVRTVGYDPYNAREFINRYTQENGEYFVEKVIQGAKTESVPLGELKILFHEKCIAFDQDMMTFALGNCIAIVDTNGNQKLYKPRHDKKIDSVAALLDAYVAYKLNKEQF